MISLLERLPPGWNVSDVPISDPNRNLDVPTLCISPSYNVAAAPYSLQNAMQPFLIIMRDHDDLSQAGARIALYNSFFARGRNLVLLVDGGPVVPLLMVHSSRVMK